jgi:hypothetical protein
MFHRQKWYVQSKYESSGDHKLRFTENSNESSGHTFARNMKAYMGKREEVTLN